MKYEIRPTTPENVQSKKKMAIHSKCDTDKAKRINNLTNIFQNSSAESENCQVIARLAVRKTTCTSLERLSTILKRLERIWTTKIIWKIDNLPNRTKSRLNCPDRLQSR